MEESSSTLKNILESIYLKYNRRKFIKTDPVQFLYWYSAPADMEIAGLLAAELAYGRVEHIHKSLDELFRKIGKSPFEFVKNFNDSKKAGLKHFRHRFTSGDDISDLLTLIRKLLVKYGSIENLFLQFYNSSDKNLVPAMTKFVRALRSMYADTHKCGMTRGIKYLLSGPDGGSACKRLNLYLRWMVRNDEIDTGLWKKLDKAKLLVPVDVHMARLCRILGFYNGGGVSLSAAEKITGAFARIRADDPARYDFALSRIGILDKCNGLKSKRCDFCDLYEFCSTNNCNR